MGGGNREGERKRGSDSEVKGTEKTRATLQIHVSRGTKITAKPRSYFFSLACRQRFYCATRGWLRLDGTETTPSLTIINN